MNAEKEFHGLRVGQVVTARIDMLSDARDQGMGILCYANKGEKLVVRKFTEYGSIAVSHPDVHDSSFCVALDEIAL